MPKGKHDNLDRISKVFVKLSDDEQQELTHVAERLFDVQQTIDKKKVEDGLNSAKRKSDV